MAEAAFELDDEQFLAIEDALAATPRGRAFLRERDARNARVALDELRRELRALRRFMRRTMAGNPQADMQLRVLRQELQEMSACIQQTRREIAALRPDEAGSNWINSATEELDAIVAATEKATSDILQAAEEIQALISRGEVGAELRSEIEARIIAVLTACSFQDITGQRTTKIVGALRYLERRINAMIEIWGAQNLAAEPLPEDGDRRPDAHLLNGPALRGGVTQDQVDELLAAIVPGEETPQAGADIGQSAIDALFD